MLITYRNIKMFTRNIAKFNQAMGFQRSSTNKPKTQPGSGRSIRMGASNLCHHIAGGPISIEDASYISWVVS